jgi:UDP-N-acetylglucosamine pyrophosphorylase
VIGLRLIPTERDLRFLWEEMPQQQLDVQSQKVQQSVRAALINWAKTTGEAEDYRDNLPSQCIHPVGHWYEIPNLFLNGTLKQLLRDNPNLKHLLVHNIDTLGANADPAALGYHIQQNKAMTVEVITRKLDDRGGGLAKINGKIRLVEGLALPDEKVEFDLSYYNTNTFWIDIDKLLFSFGLSREDLNNEQKVSLSVYKMASRMPTYVIIKEVKKRWGKGQEDIFPITQFEKLWGDMTALPELQCAYINVSRMRGQQLKEVSQLDGWSRDGSKEYIEGICKWD